MQSPIPENLSLDEFKLLLHLRTFHSPVYFDDICATFMDMERSPAVLIELLLVLQIRNYACSVKEKIVKATAVDKHETTYMAYALTELGRNAADAFNQFNNVHLLPNAE